CGTRLLKCQLLTGYPSGHEHCVGPATARHLGGHSCAGPLAGPVAATDLAHLSARQLPARRTARRRPARPRPRPGRVRDPGGARGDRGTTGTDVRARRGGAPIPQSTDPHDRPDGEAQSGPAHDVPRRPPRCVGRAHRCRVRAAAGRRAEPCRLRPQALRGGRRPGRLRSPRSRIPGSAGRRGGLRRRLDYPAGMTTPPVPDLAVARFVEAGLDVDPSTLTRALYSSDASLYRVVPAAVARPWTVDELVTTLRLAREQDIPVTMRGSGT